MLETISALHCCVLRVTILPTSVLTGTSDHRQSGCHWRGRTKPGLSSNSNSGPPDVERPLPVSGKRLRGGRRRIVKKRGKSDRRDRWKRVWAGLLYHARVTGGTRCPSQTFVYAARLTRPRPGNFWQPTSFESVCRNLSNLLFAQNSTTFRCSKYNGWHCTYFQCSKYNGGLHFL